MEPCAAAARIPHTTRECVVVYENGLFWQGSRGVHATAHTAVEFRVLMSATTQA